MHISTKIWTIDVVYAFMNQYAIIVIYIYGPRSCTITIHVNCGEKCLAESSHLFWITPPTSSLNDAPNYLVGCVIQKRYNALSATFSCNSLEHQPSS